jgi:histidinol-phosphate aminotransferase
MLTYGLEDFFRAFFSELDPKQDVVLTNELHYAYYDQIAAIKGVRIVTFRLQKGHRLFSFDLDDCMRQYRRYQPKVLLLTSPNNPTGNILTSKECSLVLDKVTKKTLVLLDEAYIGFQKAYKKHAFLRLVQRYPNFALLRTFSKDYGLAGLRFGYALCGSNVRRMLRDSVRDLGLSRIHEAVAMAALSSEPYRLGVVRRIRKTRDRFVRTVNTLDNFHACQSEANFVLVESKTVTIQRRVLRRTARESVNIVKSYGARYFRVSIGLPEHVQKLVEALRVIDK